MSSRQVVYLIIIFVVSGILAWMRLPRKEIEPKKVNQVGDLKLTSTAFGNEQSIPKEFTCDGKNINPPLTIQNVPPKTQTFALIIDDPDAPSGIFNHWVVWNISSQTREVAPGDAMSGAQQGINSAGHNRYDGPCPPRLSEAGPPKEHRYFFKLYALDTKIGLDGKAKKSDLEKAMEGHVINLTSLIGIYKR